MKLNLSQIRQITTGADRIEEIDQAFHFFRFTKEQEELYQRCKRDYTPKLFATSGVKMCFRTNSRTLLLEAEVSRGSSRLYFAFDVLVNGVMRDSLSNYNQAELPHDYTALPFPHGTFSKKFDLGEGEKEVSIYFPWSVKAVVKAISLEEKASLVPCIPEKKMLCFGDSITHGYDALHPSHKYISRLADMLGAQEYNKAIGGEIFFPALAATKEAFAPDYITVAYGTNDWYGCTQEEFTSNCKGFFSNLCCSYPNARIFVITPIWRKDMHERRPFGCFERAAQIIQEQTAGYGNVSVIRGFEFVPQDDKLYADLSLHPNDAGFACYFEGLSGQIKAIL